MLKKILAVLLISVIILMSFIAIDHQGKPEQNGVISTQRIPAEWQQQKIAAQTTATQQLN